MSQTFRAAVLRFAGAQRPYAGSRPLAIETVALPAPGEGEILVRIKAASICHSDLSVVNSDRRWPLPIVPGHEAAGVVAESGPGVTSVRHGDRVALIFLTQCGHGRLGRGPSAAPGDYVLVSRAVRCRSSRTGAMDDFDEQSPRAARVTARAPK